jgi:hypothetical protein
VFLFQLCTRHISDGGWVFRTFFFDKKRKVAYKSGRGNHGKAAVRNCRLKFVAIALFSLAPLFNGVQE